MSVIVTEPVPFKPSNSTVPVTSMSADTFTVVVNRFIAISDLISKFPSEGEFR